MRVVNEKEGRKEKDGRITGLVLSLFWSFLSEFDRETGEVQK